MRRFREHVAMHMAVQRLGAVLSNHLQKRGSATAQLAKAESAALNRLQVQRVCACAGSCLHLLVDFRPSSSKTRMTSNFECPNNDNILFINLQRGVILPWYPSWPSATHLPQPFRLCFSTLRKRFRTVVEASPVNLHRGLKGLTVLPMS